jgi:hypothetical protein
MDFLKHAEGRGRRRKKDRPNYPNICLGNGGKPRDPSAKVVGLRAKNTTRRLPNKWYHSIVTFGCMVDRMPVISELEGNRIASTLMILEILDWEGLDWIHLAQDRDHLQALVNTVMNFRVL